MPAMLLPTGRTTSRSCSPSTPRHVDQSLPPLSRAPDLPVRLPVSRRIPGRGAVAVVGRADVDGGHIPAGRPAGEGAVELVDDLPALQGQRLRHGGRLILL